MKVKKGLFELKNRKLRTGSVQNWVFIGEEKGVGSLTGRNGNGGADTLNLKKNKIGAKLSLNMH